MRLQALAVLGVLALVITLIVVGSGPIKRLFTSNPGSQAVQAVLEADDKAQSLRSSLEEVSLVSYENETAESLAGNNSTASIVKASDDLKASWDPKFEQAVQDHKALVDKIKEADEAAAAYFEKQQELTESISNPTLKNEAANSDKDELQSYVQWKQRANEILHTASPIMQDLHDIDAIIQKQNLSAHFAALQISVETLPNSIRTLHAQLDLFHQESMIISEKLRGRDSSGTEQTLEGQTENDSEEVFH